MAGLWMLAETLLPQDTFNRVCYFTVLPDARLGNQRKLVYLRPLTTLPSLKVHYWLMG